MNIIVPLNHRVLVEPEAKEEVTKGGIVIPETANQKAPTKGRVIAIAEGSDINLKISSGDIVLFPKFAGIEVVIPAAEVGKKDRMLYLIKEDDVLAVIRYEK
jgi:chaperonin GroES